jgi:hypothetical protein
MNVIPLILMAGLGVFVFYALHTSGRYRADAIQALATRFGMHYLGNALPKSLGLSGTPFDRVSKVWNVIDGEPRGTRVMAFDCQIGAGKGSWRRTVIAVETEGNISGRLRVERDMTLYSSGRWQILYRPRQGAFSFGMAGLTPIEKLEASLNGLLADSRKTSA